MADQFKRVRSGEPLQIGAPTFNAMLDAAEAHRAGVRGQTSAGPNLPNRDIIRVRNDSGAVLPRFGVLELDGPVIDPTASGADFKSALWISGLAISTPGIWYAVALVPLADGDTGPAIVKGLTICEVDFSDSSHEYANTEAGSDRLVSAETGTARIHWAVSGTGVQPALVDLLGNDPAISGMFPVLVSVDGGVGTHPATWTYTVSDLGGTVLDTGLTPEKVRPATDLINSSRGMAYYQDGLLHLYDAGEAPDFEEC